MPFWCRGDDAWAVVAAMYQLGEAVQAVTGLPGYDPQLELPLSDALAQPELAGGVFDEVAESFAERGITSPSNG
ncbi:hypothetical protein [Micromonospora sp. WMMB235]|uniref:hypothetical protein n=1 Tax=Micromonospora sp. WMMB235 TaxID=1172030 RepID=UPI0008DA25B0|nr:hypothetical protein [Micromonospora sp. WMMB235]OHX02519.1 hypothetical protein BFV98_05685 [Micromonospora sp. WMMB235]